MASGWGRIINTGSMHALVASPYKSAYNAAKHGVAGFTKTVALEVRVPAPDRQPSSRMPMALHLDPHQRQGCSTVCSSSSGRVVQLCSSSRGQSMFGFVVLLTWAPEAASLHDCFVLCACRQPATPHPPALCHCRAFRWPQRASRSTPSALAMCTRTWSETRCGTERSGGKRHRSRWQTCCTYTRRTLRQAPATPGTALSVVPPTPAVGSPARTHACMHTHLMHECCVGSMYRRTHPHGLDDLRRSH